MRWMTVGVQYPPGPNAWECLAELLRGDTTDDIVCDIGMPVIHAGVRYNCRVFVLNSEILLIRPKRDLANDGRAWRMLLATSTNAI